MQTKEEILNSINLINEEYLSNIEIEKERVKCETRKIEDEYNRRIIILKEEYNNKINNIRDSLEIPI